MKERNVQRVRQSHFLACFGKLTDTWRYPVLVYSCAFLLQVSNLTDPRATFAFAPLSSGFVWYGANVLCFRSEREQRGYAANDLHVTTGAALVVTLPQCNSERFGGVLKMGGIRACRIFF